MAPSSRLRGASIDSRPNNFRSRQSTPTAASSDPNRGKIPGLPDPPKRSSFKREDSHFPLQVYWNQISTLQSQLSRLQLQCSQLEVSLASWKTFVEQTSSEQQSFSNGNANDVRKSSHTSETSGRNPHKDALSSNLPGKLPLGIASQNYQARPSRPTDARTQSQQRRLSHKKPNDPTDWLHATHSFTQPLPSSSYSNENMTANDLISSTQYKSKTKKCLEGEDGHSLHGKSLTRWHLEQVKKLLDEPMEGSASCNVIDLTHSTSAGRGVTTAEDRMDSEETRGAARLRRQKTTAVELSSGEGDPDADLLVDQENRKRTTVSEDAESSFSGYFPIDQSVAIPSSKPKMVPPLGLKTNRLRPGPWLSGQNTQGDTYDL